MSDIFGPILVGSTVEQAVMETLRTWMPTYIEEIELQLGRARGLIPPPKMYTTRNRFESFPDDRMPMCVVVSPGFTDQPTADGEGNYFGWLGMGVGCIAAARDAEAAGFLSKLYAAAARAILLHNPGLKDALGNPRAIGTEWVDESYDDTIVSEEDKTVKAAYVLFRVKVDNVVSRWTGPITPPDPAILPGSQWPTADIVDTKVVI